MIYYDYHMHTEYSHDSKATMETMIRRAIELGLKEIVFTDHVDCLTRSGKLYSKMIDFNKYFKEFNELKQKYTGDITLTAGVELGAAPYMVNEGLALTDAYPFDFIILSSHETCMKDLWFEREEYFCDKDKKNAFTAYFEEVLENVKAFDDFSVYGHLDYIKRYGNYDDNSLEYADYSEVIDAILRTLIQKGRGIELNASGYRYGLNHTHPQLPILKRYRELGGELITVGSDAHRPDHITSGFEYCEKALKASGFKAITLYRERKPVFVDI